MRQTINEHRVLTERQLLRIERANPDHFRFPRQSGVYERPRPLADDDGDGPSYTNYGIRITW